MIVSLNTKTNVVCHSNVVLKKSKCLKDFYGLTFLSTQLIFQSYSTIVTSEGIAASNRRLSQTLNESVSLLSESPYITSFNIIYH